jgi:hypothetical protein
MDHRGYTISSDTLIVLDRRYRFAMKMESYNTLPFLDVLVTKNGTTLAIKIYMKLAHTGRYLNFDSNHPPCKVRSVRGLFHTASTIYQEQQDFHNEVGNIKHELALSGYPPFFADSIVKGLTVKSRPETEKKIPLGTVVIPYVKSVSEKFRRIGNQYNIRTVFKTSHTHRRSLVRTRPDPLDTRHCVYSTPCNVDGATSRKRADR